MGSWRYGDSLYISGTFFVAWAGSVGFCSIRRVKGRVSDVHNALVHSSRQVIFRSPPTVDIVKKSHHRFQVPFFLCSSIHFAHFLPFAVRISDILPSPLAVFNWPADSPADLPPGVVLGALLAVGRRQRVINGLVLLHVLDQQPVLVEGELLRHRLLLLRLPKDPLPTAPRLTAGGGG